MQHLLIIPYQVITGNYNVTDMMKDLAEIIPYQVITGNYNPFNIKIINFFIIPYKGLE